VKYIAIKDRPTREEFYRNLEAATFNNNATNSASDYSFMIAAREAFYTLGEDSQNRIADYCTELSSKVKLLGTVTAFEILVKIGRVRHAAALDAQRLKDRAARA
jgi:hypothetical protein